MFRRSTRPARRGCICRSGTASGRRRARRRTIIAKLNARDAWRRWPIRGYAQRLTDLGMEIPPREQQTPEALAAQQKADIEKWWPVIKAANIKGQ